MSREDLVKAREMLAHTVKLKLCDRMRGLREDNDLRQWEIAEILQIDRSTYAHYESGKTEPDCESLVKLAKFYDVSLDYLFGV